MDANALAQKTLIFARVTGELLKRAQEASATEQQKSAAVAELIPGALDAAIEGGRIQPQERDSVAGALRSHEDTLRLFTKLAMHKNAQEKAASLGEPEQAFKPQFAPRYLGAPIEDHDSTEAGQAWRAALNM